MPTISESPLAGGSSKWIRADRLSVNTYERPLSHRKVRQIVNEFDSDLLGVLYVSKRNDGTFVIMDGQHRWQAVLTMGWGDQVVPCHVWEGLSVEDEARLFSGFNDKRTKPKPLDMHNAEVAQRTERAVAIEKALAEHGLHFGGGEALNSVRSVGTLQNIYDGAGAKVLTETLTVVQRAWGSESASFQADTLKAVGMIIARHRHELDLTRLSRVLNSAGSPGSLVTSARRVRAELGTVTARVPAVVAEIIVRNYNRRLPEDKRIAWDTERSSRRYWQSSRADIAPPKRQSAEQRRRLEQGGMQPRLEQS